MGSTLSAYQADPLARNFDRAVLMLDGDAAGRQGALAIAKTLTTKLPSTVISLEDGTQPDQLWQAQIQRIMSEGDMTIPTRFKSAFGANLSVR